MNKAQGCAVPGKQGGDAFEDAGQRPRELQDWLNFHLYHPLSARIARRLVPTAITPNMVSIAGGLLVVLAAIAYQWPGGYITAALGLLLHVGWHVLDGADGDLARMTGRSSRRGEVIDGICDYASHIVLYIVLGAIVSDQLGVWGWLLVAAAGAGRILQATHFETQRRQYQWWVYQTPWLRSGQQETATKTSPIAGFASLYLGISGMLAPNGTRVDAMLDAMPDGPSEDQVSMIRIRMQKVLRLLPLLGANYRTIALGTAMLFAVPAYYFVYEAGLLSGLLAVSIWNSRQVTEGIIDQLGDNSAR